MTAAGGNLSAEKSTGVPRANNKPQKLCNDNTRIMDCHLHVIFSLSTCTYTVYHFLTVCCFGTTEAVGVGWEVGGGMRSIFFRSHVPCLVKNFKCLP